MPSWAFVSITSSSLKPNSFAAPEPVTLIGLTLLTTDGRPLVPPKLNRRRALLVLSKIDEILAWEASHGQERESAAAVLVGRSPEKLPQARGLLLLLVLLSRARHGLGNLIEDLGINFRRMTSALLERHIEPRMPAITATYDGVRRTAATLIEPELARLLPALLRVLVNHFHGEVNIGAAFVAIISRTSFLKPCSPD